jgi:hypothetical protein
LLRGINVERTLAFTGHANINQIKLIKGIACSSQPNLQIETIRQSPLNFMQAQTKSTMVRSTQYIVDNSTVVYFSLKRSRMRGGRMIRLRKGW